MCVFLRISSCLCVPCHKPYLLSQGWCGFVCVHCSVETQQLLNPFSPASAGVINAARDFKVFFLSCHLSTVTDDSHIYRAEVYNVVCASVESYSSWEVDLFGGLIVNATLKIFSYFVSQLLFHLCIISCRRLPEDACTHLAPRSLVLYLDT